MNTLEILRFLQSEIHSAVFATVDAQGLPQTCVIDLMLADETGLFFLTAKGKSFYDRLTAHPFVSLSGLKGDAKQRIRRQIWSLDTYQIGQCHWTEGFVRIFGPE